MASARFFNTNVLFETITTASVFYSGVGSGTASCTVVPSGWDTLFVQAIYSVPAGAHTFSFRASSASSGVDVQVFNTRLTALFIPSAYGSIDVD
jgi:hypothetical protein